METTVAEAKMYGSLILILDEVHRLDKAKQDFLLPHLESGLLLLIGATTANPYHSINPAIRSRCHIFELEQLQPTDIETALNRALHDKEHGLGNENVTIDKEAITHLSLACGGDVRSALNALELLYCQRLKKRTG